MERSQAGSKCLNGYLVNRKRTMVEVETKVGKFYDNLWYFHLPIAADVVEQFNFGKAAKRVLCSINGAPAFHCAFMPSEQGDYFINLNKEVRKELALEEGTLVHVKLTKDESKYGMPVAEEFEACLFQDLDAHTYFDALTPGKQRNLLHIVNKVKSSEIRIKKALVIMEHLKETAGKLDFKLLNQRFKEANQR